MEVASWDVRQGRGWCFVRDQGLLDKEGGRNVHINDAKFSHSN